MDTLLRNLKVTTMDVDSARTAASDMDEENPFMIDKVVKCISKHLDFQGLQVCRGLNQLWRETITEEFWLKNGPPLRINSRASPGSVSISKFLQMYSDTSDPSPIASLVKKYRNFILFDFDNKQDIPILYEFLLQVGPQIEFLELNKVILCRDLQDIVDILCCRYTPNLKSYRVTEVRMTEECLENLEENTISNPCAHEQKENKHLNRLHMTFLHDAQDAVNNLDVLRALVPWSDILSLYSNLTVFIAWNIPKDVFENIIHALGTIRKEDDSKLALKELECLNKNSRSAPIVDTVRDKNMRDVWWNADDSDDPLESGKCPMESLFWMKRFENKNRHCPDLPRPLPTIDDLTDNAPVILEKAVDYDLLKSAKLQLESLSIDIEIYSKFLESCQETLKKLYFKGSLLPIPFPFLWALEELTLVGCEDMRFLNQVPNLKSLNLDCKAQLNNFPSDVLPLEFLTVFKCNEDKQWKAEELKELFFWIPNVKGLEMRLSNDTFSVVCEHFPNLKELTVIGGEVDDYGIVGEVERVPRPGEGELRHSVMNLTELHTFKMVKVGRDYYWQARGGLTEKSIFSGFCYMPKLAKLVIPVKSKLSVSALRVLQSRIKDVEINVVSNLERDYEF